MLEVYREAIDEALELALPAPEEGDPAAVVKEAMRYSLLCGGKRVRPALVLAFCELCGGDWHMSMPFACAIELVLDGGRFCLEVVIPPASEPISYRGAFYFYQDGTNRILDGDALDRLLLPSWNPTSSGKRGP